MKGMQIVLPKDSKVRPTTDKLRSALFSILGDNVEGARVLDGFAGSGAFGIEAISRGAGYVFFNDLNIEAVKRNTATVQKSLFTIKKGSFLAGGFGAGYNIIFIDPPYGMINSEKILEVIDTHNLLAENGIIVYEEFYKTPFSITEAFLLTDERRYGDTVVRFLEKKP